MDKIDALDKLYGFRFEAGKNLLYWGDLTSKYSDVSGYVTLVILILSSIALACAIVGAAIKSESTFKAWCTGWISVAIATIPTLLAFYLVKFDPADTAKQCAESYERWQDVSDQAARLNNAVVSLPDNTKLDAHLTAEIDRIDTKITEVEKAELKWTDHPLLAECWRRELKQVYGLDEKGVDNLKEKNPREWARLRFGFIPDAKTLEQITGRKFETAGAPQGDPHKRSHGESLIPVAQGAQ
jgi:hypothetical protein